MKKYLFKILLATGVLTFLIVNYGSLTPEAPSDGVIARAKNLTSAAISRFSTNLETPSLDASIETEKTETVYKWKDSTGKLHYSNTAPKEVKNAAKIEISNQQNIIPSKGTGEADSAQSKAKTDSRTKEKSQLPGILESYNKPIEKARESRSKIEQRNRELEKLSQ